MSASVATFERPFIGNSNTIFKSGHLFISSKGLGWRSWKKRWFILTRTSLVFFKNDPSALPQRGGEVNLTLGGIDLNNSGSVVVREDKKLLTVLFPDGRDGRAFTLKAETSEDLYEWKTALEHALAQAPSSVLVMGHNGIFRSDTNDTTEGSFYQRRDKRPVKSLVVGRPILLALEDIDGGPSFLEKALQFLEKHGVKVEGILRQSADVEEVERRVQQYEQGKTEFGPDEDAHVIGDCVKHVLRELPSSPVPASCCTALLEAYKIDQKEARVNAMCSAIQDTFPEPNRRLLQRILKMMHMISSHASDNRMTPSAVAACMAPLLLRPLLAGECELEDDFDINGDNSAQLLAAANAANNAQAIITTLLDEYENIFDDHSLHRCSISASSQTDNSDSEDTTDDENIDIKNNGYHDAENEVDPETEDDCYRRLSGKLSESSGSAASDLYDYKSGKTSSAESVDSSGEEELAIQRLEIAKNDLRNRIAKEARGNAILQASLQRRKQALHERRLALEQDVARLQEQLQAERDLRAALEVGLSLSSEQVSGSHGMDSKTRAELEEIALAEADVARLKEKVAELHHQLSQQSQNHYGTLPDASGLFQRATNQSPPQKYFQHDFDTTLAFCNHERKQRTEEFVGADLRNIRGQVLTPGSSSRRPARHQFMDSTGLSDSKSTGASMISSVDDLSYVDSAAMPSTSRPAEVIDYPRNPSAAASTLVELTTRLDFFKERRSQLMEQLHSLDLNYETSQDYMYKSSSLKWN
ncbi:rho GTPase-activating protein 7-like isoform X3 [Olea europaea var. sylvestris]|uniref:rho GTPase-activating protein 7-like isoform X3 n=1 Tax=Olea europaea var. sylvestris TaxID=158386 RepID=UPI000C1D5D87|nr:rho GTPase-activating protein 7-like isoform X3 [Olea europaea var. sylvestris]